MVSTKVMVGGTLAVGVLAVARYLWIPVPDDLSGKSNFRAMAIGQKMLPGLYWATSSMLGFTNPFQFKRAFLSAVNPAPALDSDPQLQVTNTLFNGIQVRVYRPKSAPTSAPVLLHFHGGGWSIGGVDGEDRTTRYLAKQSDVIVVSVDYRQAPEHRFPAAVDDCMAATVHVLKHGQELGLDPTRVGLAGISAGGNLAAAVSLRLQEAEFEELPKLKFQVLLCGCFQAVDFDLPSFMDNTPVTDLILSREEMAGYYLNYAGLDTSVSTAKQMVAGKHLREKTRRELAKYFSRNSTKDEKTSSEGNEHDDSVNETLASVAEPIFLNYLLSPLLAPDDKLKRVPRAMVVQSFYDVLRDDSLLYTQRLRQVGVDVTSHMITGGHHLSLPLLGPEPDTEGAAQAYDNIVKFIHESCLS